MVPCMSGFQNVMCPSPNFVGSTSAGGVHHSRRLAPARKIRSPKLGSPMQNWKQIVCQYSKIMELIFFCTLSYWRKVALHPSHDSWSKLSDSTYIGWQSVRADTTGLVENCKKLWVFGGKLPSPSNRKPTLLNK